MVYGGWPHALGSDWPDPAGSGCIQWVGYHLIIVDGLLDLHGFLRLARACPQPAGGYWTFACDNLPSNMLAALAWINNIQQPSGKIPAFAQSSTSILLSSLVDDDVTDFGTAMYYRLFSYLHAQGFRDTTPVKVAYDGSTRPLSTIRADAVAAVRYTASVLGTVAPEVLFYYRQQATGEVGW